MTLKEKALIIKEKAISNMAFIADPVALEKVSWQSCIELAKKHDRLSNGLMAGLKIDEDGNVVETVDPFSFECYDGDQEDD